MRKLAKQFLMTGMLIVGITVLTASFGHAVNLVLDVSEISFANFDADFSTTKVASITDTFNVPLAGDGGTDIAGTVVSAVFPGDAGDSTGQYAYLYQINVTSGTGSVSGLNIAILDFNLLFLNQTIDSVDGGADLFQITSGTLTGDVAALFSLGDQPIDDDGSTPVLSTTTNLLEVEFALADEIFSGESSRIFLYKGPTVFTVSTAEVFDGPGGDDEVDVLIPGPEPATVLLLGSGLLGLLGVRRRRRRLA